MESSDSKMTEAQLEALRSFPIGDKLPNRLRLAMLLQDLSIRELSKASGVHRDTIRDAVHGRETMRVETAIKLATALSVTIDDIFPGPELWPKD